MENFAGGQWHRPQCVMMFLLLIFFVRVIHAEAVPVSPPWMVGFSAGESSNAVTASPMAQGNVLVTILPFEAARMEMPSLKHGSVEVPIEWCAADPVSRLVFITPGDARKIRNTPWQSLTKNSNGETYLCTGPDGVLRGTSQGWVKQVAGKVLPFALLRIDFENRVPPCGTAVVDSTGKVAALVFQKEDGTRTCYAIPAEAVLRVQRDMQAGGKLVRGWLGLTLLPENEVPTVVKVFTNSPADQVGLKPHDILQEVGGRQVLNYADAANAFFYLRSGEPVVLKFRRGAVQWEITAIPSVEAKD